MRRSGQEKAEGLPSVLLPSCRGSSKMHGCEWTPVVPSLPKRKDKLCSLQRSSSSNTRQVKMWKKLKPHALTAAMYNGTATLKTVCWFIKGLFKHGVTLWPSTSTLSKPRENENVHTNTRTLMFAAAVRFASQTRKQPKCSTGDGQQDAVRNTCNETAFPEWKGRTPGATTAWMSPEGYAKRQRPDTDAIY